MAIIYNSTDEKQTVKAQGNWFTFKPGEIKLVQQGLGNFLCENKSYKGFVMLPDSFEDLEFRATDEGKKILAERKKEGVRSYLAHMRRIGVRNVEALQQDLDRANIKADARSFMKGELEALEILAKYHSKGEDENQKKVDRVKELERELGLHKGNK